MPNSIGHFEICVKNREKGVEFYKNLFEWNVQDYPGMDYAMVTTGEEPGGGIFQAMGEMKPYVTIYVTVDDINAIIDKAVEMGGMEVQRKALISEEFGYYGMFADPDGNVIGLWSKK